MAVQTALGELEGQNLSRMHAMQLFGAQSLAIHRLWLLTSDDVARRLVRPVKEAQIRLAGGRPLAVCVGTFKRHSFKEPFYRDATATPRGIVYRDYCGVVFEDTLRLSGRPFSSRCQACNREITQRKRAAETVFNNSLNEDL